MSGFSNLRAMVDAENNGQSTLFTWRKSPTQVTTAGVWFDLSMSPGNPVPQYYASAPYVSVQMKQSDQGGIFHGANVAPLKKHLRITMAMTTTTTALPMPLILCDYLLYYPFVEEADTNPVSMVNSIGLPRYTDGAGVKIMAVSLAARTGGQTFYVTYTNQAGESGRVTRTVRENTAAAVGHIVSTQTANALAAGPFLPLQAGDTGVRSIESLTMVSGVDVGLLALVLVKPLAQTQIRGIDAPVEKDYFLEAFAIPQIEDDAFLGFLCLPNGSLAATAIHGYLSTVWN